MAFSAYSSSRGLALHYSKRSWAPSGWVFPCRHRALQPRNVAVLVSEQAGVRTVGRAETCGGLGVGYIVDLMIAGFKHKSIHDSRHMAAHAAAAFAGGGVMRVRLGMHPVLGVAVDAHSIGIGAIFERPQIGGGIRRVRIVTTAALRCALAKTCRTHERFHDEYRLAETAVLIETTARIIHIRAAHQLTVKLAPGFGIIESAGGLGIAQTCLHMAL